MATRATDRSDAILQLVSTMSKPCNVHGFCLSPPPRGRGGGGGGGGGRGERAGLHVCCQHVQGLLADQGMLLVDSWTMLGQLAMSAAHYMVIVMLTVPSHGASLAHAQGERVGACD